MTGGHQRGTVERGRVKKRGKKRKTNSLPGRVKDGCVKEKKNFLKKNEEKKV